MIDIISLSIAIGAVLVSLTTHIKFSKCWGFEVTTRTPLIQTPPPTPLINNDESTTLLKGSKPINIENKRKPFVKNWL